MQRLGQASLRASQGEGGLGCERAPARFVWSVVLLAALSLLPAEALARSGSRPGDGEKKGSGATGPRDKLAELTRQGAAALAAQDFATAERVLGAAYRQAPAPQQLYPLAQLALLQGRIVPAQDLFRRFLHDTTEPENSPNRQEAQRVLQLPAPPTGEIRIVGDRNAVVLIDDQLVGVLPLPLPLLLGAGEHRVVLERDTLRLDDSVLVMAGRLAEVRCQFQLGVLVMTVVPALLLVTDATGLGAEPQQRLERSLLQVASALHMSILMRGPALLQAPKLADCLNTQQCRIELAAQNAVQYVLSVAATTKPGAPVDWQLTTSVLDVTVQDVAAQERSECTACTAEQVADRLAQSTETALTQALARRRGTIAITSTPSGIEVRSGERSLGVTPIRRPQWVGALPLTLSQRGYLTQQAELTVEEGKTASLQITLQPEPVAATPRPLLTRTVILPRPRWRLGVGAAALGLGLAIGGLGISALTQDGQCVADSYVGASCRNVYTTVGIGTGLLVSGALLIGGGVTLLALPGARRQVVVAAEAAPSP